MRLLDGLEPLLDRRRRCRRHRLLFELCHGVARAQRQRAHVIDPLAKCGELLVLRFKPSGLAIDEGTLLVEQLSHVIEGRSCHGCDRCCGLRR